MFDELRDMNNEIRKKQEKLDEMRALATSMTQAYDNVRVQTSSSDRLSNLMCKIIMLENELDGMIDDYADEKERAKLRIYQVEREAWQDILYSHYIEHKSLGEIAKQTGKSLNSVRQLNSRAIKSLKAIDITKNL